MAYRKYSPELMSWTLEYRYFESDMILGRHCQILYQETEWRVTSETIFRLTVSQFIILAPNCQLWSQRFLCPSVQISLFSQNLKKCSSWQWCFNVLKCGEHLLILWFLVRLGRFKKCPISGPVIKKLAATIAKLFLSVLSLFSPQRTGMSQRKRH